MGGSANPIKKVAGLVTGLTQKAASAVPIIGEPVAGAIGGVSQAVGITSAPEAAPVAATPVAAAGESSTTVQTAAVGTAGATPSQSGGELEVAKGAGRLNKNVQRSRAQFRTPSANTGAAGSSIRI